MKLALAQQRADLDRDANLARALDAMGRARKAGAELVVFPELAIERFFPQKSRDQKAQQVAETIPGRISDKIATRARELSLVTVFNMYESDGRGRFFDSSPVFVRNSVPVAPTISPRSQCLNASSRAAPTPSSVT